jgi:hypothetical protein
MSAAIYITAEKPSSADRIAVDGKQILVHLDNLSAIGEEHGLRRLDEYIDYAADEMLDFFDESMLTAEQIDTLSQEQWFDPTEGLTLINSYIDVVKHYHSLSETTKHHCLEELYSYRAVLEILAKAGINWHFSCDI